MCVSAAYSSAKALVRDLAGGPSVHLYVAYTNTKSADNPASAGIIAGKAAWGDSPPLQLHPGNLYGWQEETFTLTGGNNGSDAQVYNLWVDPRCFG